tara:strand:+ start:2478 stop:3062 length:585 start_codon:yes stop_codon:yes gene_type:complete
MSKFLQRLRREQGQDANPVEQVAKKVGKDLEAFALTQGSAFVRLITSAAKSARIPRQNHGYLFWVLVEQSNQWPPLDPAKKTALEQAVYLMETSNSTPNYTSSFEIPDAEVEEAVENVIEAAATWAKGPLRASLLRKYMALLDAVKRSAAKTLGTDPANARAQVEGALLTAVHRHPRWFTHPGLLYWALKVFIR